MSSRHVSAVLSLILAATALAWGVSPSYAGPGGGTYYANSPAGGITGTALRKFVDSLPGICEVSGPNNLGQCIPLATPDTGTFSGSDYYVLGLRDYTEKMHSDLPKATRLRGYYQINSAGTSSISHYLGPLILATRNRPVRVQFENRLSTSQSGTAANLFIPVDTSIMGAGMSPTSPDGTDCNVIPKDPTCYTENRATLHLHGGNTPWISDGTPHQWTVPVGDTAAYQKGLSTRDVPDMPASGQGKMTFFWTNQQSGRLMFYHDHAYGITRLNVYAGEAAGYLLVDPAEEASLKTLGVPGTIPNPGNLATADLAHLIPLVLQDKTFVPQNISVQDSKWETNLWGTYGDLWFPHVYEANQDPNSPDGANPFGRWDYGPWFWPPVNVDADHSVLPVPSTTPEAFMDTPLVNGTAYPYLQVHQEAYRFRILNASNDRPLNLSLFLADPGDPTGKEVKMVPAGPDPTYPPDWPTDGRAGGVPDPLAAGPNMIQIGSEGGALPNPVVIPNRPIGYDYNRRNIVVLNTLYRALMLGPAERADVIVDFSGLPVGTRVILYNDGPAPNPAFDTRYDYYTGDADQTTSGGAPSTMVGYGPNTRTIMQFQVIAPSGTGTAFGQAKINALAAPTGLPAIFKAAQPAPIVPETVFNSVGYANPPANDLYSKIADYSLTFTPMDASITGYTNIPLTVPFQSKAIQELWDPWGRMNATLGVELPFTTNLNQTTIPMGYVEPPTETVVDGQPQIWKITHNGVDTHPVHFHLFNVQLLNRVGWDGAIRPPDDNEYGWKETVRMNPLEDAIVALQPLTQTLPFPLPISTRPLDVTVPLGAPVATTDLTVTPPAAITVPNAELDYGFEYVWHCHILGHEENDFMRPMVFRVPQAAPAAPSGLVATNGGPGTGSGTNEITLAWTDNSNNQSVYRIERNGVPIGNIVPLPNYQPAYVDSQVGSSTTYTYQVIAVNQKGSTPSNTAGVTSLTFSNATNVTLTANKPSPHPMGTNVLFTAVATGPSPSMVYKYKFSLNNVMQQDYSTLSSWALSAATPTGVYSVMVEAQAAPSMSPVSTSMTYSVIVPASPIVTVDPTTLPGIYTGPTVTVLMSTNVPAIIYYTTDGTVPTTLSPKYMSGINVSSTKTITYYAVDQNGTPSEVGSGTWTIHSPDMVASMLINNGAISTNTTTVNLTLSAVDPSLCSNLSFSTGVQTMQFSNDNVTYSAEEPYSTSKVWTLASGIDGVRTVYVKFRDCSLPLPGGTLYSAISAAIAMDTVPPLTTASPPPGIYTGPTVTVTLGASKLANIYYTTDGTPPTTLSTKYVAPLVTAETTTINYFAVDLAGNVETTIKTGTWAIDKTAMVASVQINGGAERTRSSTVTLALSAADPANVVTMQFSNDGTDYTAEEAYGPSKTWSLTPTDGMKTVYVRFRDGSLPTGKLKSPVTASITLDTVAPATTAKPLPGTFTGLPMEVTLAANETATIYYTTDGTTPTTASAGYSSAAPISISSAVPITIKYFAVDTAGNIEEIKSGTWTALPGGDLGFGGTVNDSLRALMISVGIVTPTATDLMNGDVAPLVSGKPKPDGVIDLGDAVVLLRKAVGLVTW